MNNGTHTVLSGLDLNLLLMLRALLQETSVSRAARELGTTQPTVSRGLSSLREAFEDPLLIRTGRGMVLSPVGRALITPLDQALAVLERLKSVREFEPTIAMRTFHIMMPDVIGCGVIGPLRRALASCPGVGFSVLGVEGNSLGALLSGGTELVVGAPEITHSDLYTRVIPTAVPWSVVLGPEHPQWTSKLHRNAWLKSEHVQLLPAGQPNRESELQQLLERRSERRNIRVQVTYLSGLRDLIESSAMVTSLPTPTALWLAKGRRLKVVPHPVKELPPLKLRLTWHAVHQQDEGHRWFREMVADQLVHFLEQK